MARLSSKLGIQILLILVMVAILNCESKPSIGAQRKYPFAALGLINESEDQQDGAQNKATECSGCADGGVDGGQNQRHICGCCCCGCKNTRSTPKPKKTDAGCIAVPAPLVTAAEAESKLVTLKHEYNIYLNLGGQGVVPLVATNNINDAGDSAVDAGVGAALNPGSTSPADSGLSVEPGFGVSTTINSGTITGVDGGQGKKEFKEITSVGGGIQVIHYQSSNDAPAFIIVNTSNTEKKEIRADSTVPTEALEHLKDDLCSAWKNYTDSSNQLEGCTFCSALEKIQIIFILVFSILATIGKAVGGGAFAFSLHKIYVDSGLPPLVDTVSKIFSIKKEIVGTEKEQGSPDKNPLNEEIRAIFNTREANIELTRQLGVFVPQNSAQALLELMNKHKNIISSDDWKKIGKYLHFVGEKIELRIEVLPTIFALIGILIGSLLYILAALLFIGTVLVYKNLGLALISFLGGCVVVGLAGTLIRPSTGLMTACRNRKVINN